jgi:hypothetical protein
MTLLPIHIAAGMVAIIAGFIALFVVKGGSMHRKSGTLFVYTMLTAMATGTVIAVIGNGWGTALGGLLGCYLVVSALMTVRRDFAAARSIDVAAMIVGFAVAAAYLTFGILAVQSPTGRFNGYGPPLYFIMGSITSLAVVGDVRCILGRALVGPRRLARHLWRMCFATFLASGSFFLGQAKVFPKPLRIMPILITLAVLPLLVMLYYQARDYARRRKPAARAAAATRTVPLKAVP